MSNTEFSNHSGTSPFVILNRTALSVVSLPFFSSCGSCSQLLPLLLHNTHNSVSAGPPQPYSVWKKSSLVNFRTMSAVEGELLSLSTSSSLSSSSAAAATGAQTDSSPKSESSLPQSQQEHESTPELWFVFLFTKSASFKVS